MDRIPRYFRILSGKESPWYLKARDFKVDFSSYEKTEELWRIHNECVEEMKDGKERKSGENDLIDLKIEITKRILERCHLCERKCGVNRLKGEVGVCGVRETRVSSEFLHIGEEPELIPSHTIFFSGCTFKCIFCQNWDISQSPDKGRIIPPKKLSEIIEYRGGRNVNWVGGDPTSNLLYILEVLKCCNEKLPQIWNSNMYLTKETMNLLNGIIDLYLTDFKYGNNECGRKLSKIKRYWEVVTRNHLEAERQCEIILRHLVLPSHFDCCTKLIIDWISENLTPGRTIVNIMDQYHPDYKILSSPEKYAHLGRRLSMREFIKAYKYGKKKGLIYV